MARDQEPVTAAEFDRLRAEMDRQREELLVALAEDLGGDPDDYRMQDPVITDGGD